MGWEPAGYIATLLSEVVRNSVKEFRGPVLSQDRKGETLPIPLLFVSHKRRFPNQIRTH